MVLAVVLGSAAGGGFPQWNSNAPACRRARRGDPAARVRSQASLAVSSNNQDWFVLNATPDLRLQIEAAPRLHPRTGLRSSPISGVVLTGGDVDAIAGLLHLRERHRFNIYAPSRVLAIIAANPILLIRRDRKRRLRTHPRRWITPSRAPAGRRVRIPLWETAARGRAEDNRKDHRVASPDLPAPADRVYLTSAQA